MHGMPTPLPVINSPGATTGGGGDHATAAPVTSPATPAASPATAGVMSLDQAIAGLTQAVSDLQAAVASLQNNQVGATVAGGGASTMSGCCAAMSDASTHDVLTGGGELSSQDAGAQAAPDAPAAPAGPDAPAAAKVDVARWISGNTTGINQELLTKLAQVGEKIGEKVTIVSGFRSRDEQKRLYNLYKAGKGNLAAPPGHSNHETGNAVDVNINGTSLALNPRAKAAALALGLGFPVKGEPWHVEVKK